MRNSIAAGAAAFFLVLCIAGAKDAHALRLGRVEANPYLQFSSYYDDNVFATSSNEVDDWYFVVSPGLMFKLPQRDNLFELEYRADIFRYVDTGDGNDTEDHSLRAAADINFPGGLSIKVDDLARKAHEPRGDQNLAVTSTAEVNEYYSNMVNAEVSYALSDRFKVAAAYENYFINYKLASNEFRDRTDNGASASVYYRFLPKTSVLVQGIFKDVYHNNDDPAAPTLNSDEYWALAGLTWEVTAKSTGTIKGGYEWKLFDFPGRKDFRSPVFQVILDHRFTPKTAIKLTGLRQAYETDDPSVNYYTTIRGTAEATYRPLRKIELRPYGSYAHNKYSDETTVAGQTARRTDDVWSAGLDATYDMNKWLSFTLGYRHTDRSSNLDFYDYTDNLVLIRFKAVI